MPLQRGSFGIEFDERQGFPYGKLWWAVLLIPVVALTALFFRGCRGGEAPTPFPDDPLTLERRDAPGQKEPRAPRPSIFRHFAQTRGLASAGGGTKTQVAAAEAKEDKAAAALDALVPSIQKQSPEVRQLLQQIVAREAEDDLVGARSLYRILLVRKDAEEIRTFVERKIGELGTALILSDRPSPEKVKCRIAEGDLIGKLTKKYGNTLDYVLKINGIEKPESLRIGRELWVLKNPVFELIVFKKSGSAVLTLNGLFFKRYSVKAGKPENVPSGVYAVSNRLKKPVDLTDEGDESAAKTKTVPGRLWISLTAIGTTPEVRGLGLHGIWREQTLGRQVDAARLRFGNVDIIELYVLLPIGTVVNITE